MASYAPMTGRRPHPPPVYRAEAYRDTELLRETVWGCEHEHRTVQGALNCGHQWMGAQKEAV